jgi:glycosyltransferase involved in cell wall biosynthesis
MNFPSKTVKMNSIRVALIHGGEIAPYIHPIFEELSKKMDLIVYYCLVNSNIHKWDLWPRRYYYKYKVLPRIPIKTLIGTLSLNPSILNEIIKNRPDIIVIGNWVDPTMWLAFAIAKLLKIPIVYWTEGIKEPRSNLGMITRPLRMLFVKKANAIIVPGKLSKKYIIDLGADVEKAFISPNVIDNDLFIKISQRYLPLKEKLREKIGLKDKIVILSVAQLIKRKGIEYLLHAYAKLEHEHDNLMLIVIGSGPLEHHLKNLSKSLGLRNVRFMPSGIKLSELIKFYCLADIFVLPTLEDVWGFVINEAMICGLPVISTYISQAALEMIVNGRNGYIVKEANVKELFLSLKKLVCNPEIRREMGRKSFEIVIKKFNINEMSHGFIKAIKYVLNMDG